MPTGDVVGPAAQRFLQALEHASPDETAFASVLDTLTEVAERTGAHGDRVRDDWVNRTLADLQAHLPFDPVPQATVQQVHRRAVHRAALLGQGAFDVESLVEARGPTRGAVESWLSREHAGNRLLRVADDTGRSWVPGIVLDASGARLGTFPQMGDVLGPLASAGLSDWAMWTWLATPGGWPDESAPRELLEQRRFDDLAQLAREFAATSGPGLASVA